MHSYIIVRCIYAGTSPGPFRACWIERTRSQAFLHCWKAYIPTHLFGLALNEQDSWPLTTPHIRIRYAIYLHSLNKTEKKVSFRYRWYGAGGTRGNKTQKDRNNGIHMWLIGDRLGSSICEALQSTHHDMINRNTYKRTKINDNGNEAKKKKNWQQQRKKKKKKTAKKAKTRFVPHYLETHNCRCAPQTK